MRSILRLGTESQEPAFKPYRISREEAEVLANISENAIDEVDANMDAATRMVAITDAMEDMACIADEIQEMTPTESALIQTASRMAVAGSDVAPEEIVPAMENLGRPGMEMAESLRERAKAIWDGVMKTASGVWEKISTWLSTIFNRAEFIRSTVDEVREALKKAEEHQNAPLKVDAGTAEFLTTASKTITNAADLKKQIMLELESAKWVLEVYSKDLLNIGGRLAKAYEHFDINNVDGFIKEISSAVTKDLKFPGRQAGEPHRYPNTDCYVGHELMLSVSLVERIGIPKQKGNVLSELEALYSTDIILDSTSIKTKPAPRDIEFTLPTFKDCEDLLKLAEEIADVIEKFSRGSMPKELLNVRREIDAAIAKNPEAIAKAFGKSDESLTQEQQAMLKACASMTVAFTNWVKDPIRSMVKHIDSVAHTAIWIAVLADERYNPATTFGDGPMGDEKEGK